MRVILVPVAGRPESALALDCAFDLARAHDADVVACHLRPHRNMPPPDPGGPLLAADETPRLSQKQVQTARDAAHRLFDQRAEKHGFPLRKKPTPRSSGIAIWEEFVGSAGRALAIVGPIADLLVLTRPKTARSSRARNFLLAAILHSGRPVLVLSARKQKTPGRNIAIVWDQSTETAMAVFAAMPILHSATRVTIVACGDEDSVGPKSKHLLRYLAHWNISATVEKSTRGDQPAAIEKVCDKVGADLVIMGAYSHGKLRERLFGGLTEHMLFKSKRAVLMLEI